MKRDAYLSRDRRFRYSLSRIWDSSKDLVLFICLNPSTADGSTDDPTVTKCINFARVWDYGGVLVGNLFALRSTDSSKLYQAADPIGPENDKRLEELVARAKLVVVAWGNEGTFKERSRDVLRILPNPHTLVVNKTGEPRHPLYVSLNTQPIPYTVSAK